jgi:hypothetical protein
MIHNYGKSPLFYGIIIVKIDFITSPVWTSRKRCPSFFTAVISHTPPSGGTCITAGLRCYSRNSFVRGTRRGSWAFPSRRSAIETIRSWPSHKSVRSVWEDCFAFYLNWSQIFYKKKKNVPLKIFMFKVPTYVLCTACIWCTKLLSAWHLLTSRYAWFNDL